MYRNIKYAFKFKIDFGTLENLLPLAICHPPFPKDKMTLWLPKNLTELKQHLNDPLFKNAYFLMLSSVTSAGSGIKL